MWRSATKPQAAGTKHWPAVTALSISSLKTQRALNNRGEGAARPGEGGEEALISHCPALSIISLDSCGRTSTTAACTVRPETARRRPARLMQRLHRTRLQAIILRKANCCRRKCHVAIGAMECLLLHQSRKDIRAGKKSAEPFGYQAICQTRPGTLGAALKIYAAANYPRSKIQLWTGERATRKRKFTSDIYRVSSESRQPLCSDGGAV